MAWKINYNNIILCKPNMKKCLNGDVSNKQGKFTVKAMNEGYFV